MDPAELIIMKLKCLNRWLKSNKIRINADKTIGDNKINETSVTKFSGIHFDKKLNCVIHTTLIHVYESKVELCNSYNLNACL